MTSIIKLAALATAAFLAGGLATYATITRVSVTATCQEPTPSDDGMKAFLSQPDAPLTGYKRY